MTTDPNTIQLPRPTAWPMVLALGLSLIFAGMVTSLAVGILGLVLTIAGIVGWFRQVLPHEQHVSVSIRDEQVEIASLRTLIQHPPHAASESPRKILPVETFLISNGIKGGIAGGTAMVVPATYLQPAEVSQSLVLREPVGGGRLRQLVGGQ